MLTELEDSGYLACSRCGALLAARTMDDPSAKAHIAWHYEIAVLHAQLANRARSDRRSATDATYTGPRRRVQDSFPNVPHGRRAEDKVGYEIVIPEFQYPPTDPYPFAIPPESAQENPDAASLEPAAGEIDVTGTPAVNTGEEQDQK